MNIFYKKFMTIVIGCSFSLLTGCVSHTSNGGQLTMYRTPSMEAAWIRNGDPILFDGTLWYPTDNVENIQDAEVYLMGEYQEVQFFIEKTDVKPYDRLYTKFGENQFRSFAHREE